MCCRKSWIDFLMKYICRSFICTIAVMSKSLPADQSHTIATDSNVSIDTALLLVPTPPSLREPISLNTVLTVLALGSAPQDDPWQNVFYRIWSQLEYNKLLNIQSPNTPASTLSSRGL